MVSGVTKDTAQNLLIEAAVIYKNIAFDSSTKKFSGTVLSATSGGVEISVDRKLRKADVDGANHMDVEGFDFVESASASVKATLVEFTASNYALASGGDVKASTEYPGFSEVTTKRYIDENDYLEGLAVMGKVVGSGQPVIFMLDKALVVSAVDIKTEDKKEAGLEVELRATATIEQLQGDNYPWRTLFPGVDPAEG